MKLTIMVVHEEQDHTGKTKYITKEYKVSVNKDMQAHIIHAVNARATHRVSVNISEAKDN